MELLRFDDKMLTEIFNDSQVRIKQDSHHSLLMVGWIGRQSKDSVMKGCMKILESMVEYKCFDILNDNRHVIGDWSDASEWVGSVWFPLMQDAGLHKFAWVKGHLDIPKASIDKTLSFSPPNVLTVRIFAHYNNAMNWLLEGD